VWAGAFTTVTLEMTPESAYGARGKLKMALGVMPTVTVPVLFVLMIAVLRPRRLSRDSPQAKLVGSSVAFLGFFFASLLRSAAAKERWVREVVVVGAMVVVVAEAMGEEMVVEGEMVVEEETVVEAETRQPACTLAHFIEVFSTLYEISTKKSQ